LKKRVFVTEYVGLGTRLEALAMAFMISDYFGHEVCIDWRDVDALNIVGATFRRRGMLGRIDSIKLREDLPSANFHRIARHTNVNLRTHQGPRHLLERYYLPTARRVKLRPDLIDAIRAGFAPYADRPLVGVHIRRGDFPLMSESEFDVNAAVWPAVPDWWYEHVMGEIQKAVPEVAFYVSCSGSLDDFPHLAQRFPVFEIATESPYGYKGPTHHSKRHPAADLFALGCCSTLVATTCSTFSHYAANMLGEPTTVLLPPAYKIFANRAVYCSINMHGRGAFDWYEACRTGRGLKEVTDADTLPISHGASVDWM